MGRAIIMHIDDAPWVRGGAKGEGDHPDGGGQLVGDLEKGPWIHINLLQCGIKAQHKSHDHDEVMYIVEGGFSMGRRQCGPGTVVYIEANTQYGFEVWNEGVRFLNIRQGRSRYTEAGQQSVDPYEKESSSS